MGRKHWEKDKLLVMSNFSFSHSVFKRLVLQTCNNQGLFGKGLNIYYSLTSGPMLNKCLLGVGWWGGLKSWSQNSIPYKNPGCYGNQMEFSKQLFKNLLLWNHCSDFEIISQEYSLGDPFQKVINASLHMLNFR